MVNNEHETVGWVDIHSLDELHDHMRTMQQHFCSGRGTASALDVIGPLFESVWSAMADRGVKLPVTVLPGVVYEGVPVVARTFLAGDLATAVSKLEAFLARPAVVGLYTVTAAPSAEGSFPGGMIVRCHVMACDRLPSAVTPPDEPSC